MTLPRLNQALDDLLKSPLGIGPDGGSRCRYADRPLCERHVLIPKVCLIVAPIAEGVENGLVRSFDPASRAGIVRCGEPATYVVGGDHPTFFVCFSGLLFVSFLFSFVCFGLVRLRRRQSVRVNSFFVFF